MEHIGTIFLIDDDTVVNYLHAKALSRAGVINTKAFDKADEALEFFKQEGDTGSKDVIFLDLNMPGMDGWEFLEAFRALPESVTGNYRVLIISSSIDPKDIERSKTFDVHAFVSKPLTSDKMTDLLARLNA